MDKRAVADELRRFAEERLNAAAYADCTHRFALFECAKCGGFTFSVEIERHGSDEPGDFHGILRTTCAGCGDAADKLGIVREGEPRVAATDRPRCECAGETFHVGMCERWEDWGFFDEGTVVAMCSACGARKPLVDTD